jgi:hypothetical protein
MILLSFELPVHRKVSQPKMDGSNKNVKNKPGAICTPDYRQPLTQRSYFEIPKQSAEIS